ncbi:MAG: hypothetical protein R1F54_06575 [Candidatus Zeuxoniibacter abyssi]|nr:MAG: hypothetical protein R1F54_06575 [Candidatus Persebacteraceae bacterium AB1(2)]
MKIFYKTLIFLVTCFVNNGALAHCKYGTKDISWELIGEKFEDARLRIYGVFPDPDTDDLDLYEEVVELWYAVDKERRYFHLSVVDGIVTTISWEDPCFITAKDIRIGDKLIKVHRLYPDAEFRRFKWVNFYDFCKR